MRNYTFIYFRWLRNLEFCTGAKARENRAEAGGLLLSREGWGGASGSSLKNLHTMVEGVGHDDAPVAVDGNAATRSVELSIA